MYLLHHVGMSVSMCVYVLPTCAYVTSYLHVVMSRRVHTRRLLLFASHFGRWVPTPVAGDCRWWLDSLIWSSHSFGFRISTGNERYKYDIPHPDASWKPIMGVSPNDSLVQLQGPRKRGNMSKEPGFSVLPANSTWHTGLQCPLFISSQESRDEAPGS